MPAHRAPGRAPPARADAAPASAAAPVHAGRSRPGLRAHRTRGVAAAVWVEGERDRQPLDPFAAAGAEAVAARCRRPRGRPELDLRAAAAALLAGREQPLEPGDPGR